MRTHIGFVDPLALVIRVAFVASLAHQSSGGRGPPESERLLAQRGAFEHEVRRFLTRAQERGYAYSRRFPRMPTTWVDFVNQNKAAESEIARLNVRRAYESGRHDAAEAVTEG